MSANDHFWQYVFQDPEFVGSFVTYNVSLVAAACLLYYDYFLTFADEVRVVWKAPWSLATVLFLLIRYGFIVDVTLVLLYNVRISSTSGPDVTPQSCRAMYMAATSLQLVNFSMVSLFVAVRIMSLWSRNFYLGTFLFLLGVANPSSLTQSLGFGFSWITAPWPMPACVGSVAETNALWELIILDLPIASSAISIGYEVLCLALTVAKTVGNYREQRKIGMRTPLSELLLRDGSMYFFVMFALALFDIVAATVPTSNLPNDINSTLSRVLTPILTTRFISHLRTMNDPDGTRDSKLVSMMNFATSQCPPVGGRFVGSLGGDLDFGLNGFETDDRASNTQALPNAHADGSEDSTAILEECRQISSRTGST
ncbi:hypothetical protein K466DRAFT_602229 [Polyporus arcularius HHB13444]|uniref:DUF6533 domain-containing protein n=1 Tax=Polyporus arcularius HHB13444 TaxID=1314778 RepID=A0A5C3P3W6_9APHY|nr:hypothetical protein K466DRAFT_602229 [Polyporus arcularius HHB13444]